MFNQTSHWIAVVGKHSRRGNDAPTLIRTQDWNTYYFGDSNYRGIGLREKFDNGTFVITNDFGLMSDDEAKDNYRNMHYKVLRSAELYEYDPSLLMEEHASKPFESTSDLAGIIKPNGRFILPEAKSTIGIINILIAKELPFSEWKKRTAMKEDLFKWLYSQSYFGIVHSGDVIYHQPGGNIGRPPSSRNEYVPPVFNEWQYEMMLTVSNIFMDIGSIEQGRKLKNNADHLFSHFGK